MIKGGYKHHDGYVSRMTTHAKFVRIRDHRNYDALPSFGASLPQQIPQELNTDAGLWVPNQNQVNPEFPNSPAQPNGCTNFTQSGLATDLDKKLRDPYEMEKVTRADALGGLDIQVSFKYARQLGYFKADFEVTPKSGLDAFDAGRIAQLFGLTDGEMRSISWGCPWFRSWEDALLGTYSRQNPDGSWTTGGGLPKATVLPMPTDEELNAVRKNPNAVGWHNSKVAGWNTVPQFLDYSWQGEEIGDKGIVRIPREVYNVVMSLKYTIAKTASNMPVENPVTIGLPFTQKYLSMLWNLLLSVAY